MKRFCRLIGLLTLAAASVPQAISAGQAGPRRRAASPRAERPGAGAFRIAGRVIDATTGAPLAGATVSINVDNDPVETTAGGDGSFAFDGLKAGKYPLYARARGYVQEGYNQHGAFLTAAVTGNGLDSEHLVFKLHPEAVLYGKVTDERGEALRHAQVRLFSADGGWGQRRVAMVSQKNTDDLGEYRFAHLRAGKYYVAVEARPWYAQTGFRYMPEQDPQAGPGTIIRFSGPRQTPADSMLDVVYPVTFYPGVTDGSAAGQIALDWGESEEADVSLQAVPSVHILVTNLPTDDKGNANYGVGAMGRVLGRMEYGVPASSAQVGPGEYEIAGLPPGEVTLRLFGQGGAAMAPLEVDASEGQSVDARGARANASVSGQLIFPAGSASVTAGQVILANGDGRNFGARLEKDGTFKFREVEAGTYRVMVGVQGERFYASKMTAAGAKANGRDVVIEGAGDVSLVVTLGRGLGRVTGLVEQDGKPAAGTMVILTPESGQDMEQDTRIDESDSDGTFTLANIIPGKYVLIAIADGWDLEWAKPGALQPYRTKGQVLQIEGDENKEVTVEVQRKTTAAER